MFRERGGSRAGIRTRVTGAKTPHPGPLDDPATPVELSVEGLEGLKMGLPLGAALGLHLPLNLGLLFSRKAVTPSMTSSVLNSMPKR